MVTESLGPIAEEGDFCCFSMGPGAILPTFGEWKACLKVGGCVTRIHHLWREMIHVHVRMED